jgi:hypothetical protein
VRRGLSRNPRRFTAEMGIHFTGLRNVDKPVVLVFPDVSVNCGTAEFAVPETELRVLSRSDAGAG